MDLHIKDILKKYVRQDKIQEGYLRQKIERYWRENMGKSIVSRTKRIQLRNGELSITLDSASLKNDLFMNRDRIKSVINAYLSEDIIKKVIIK